MMKSIMRHMLLLPLFVLLHLDVGGVCAKPAVGPCIDCIAEGKHHEDAASHGHDVADDADAEGVARIVDVEQLTHAGAHGHDVVPGEEVREGEGEPETASEDIAAEAGHQDPNAHVPQAAEGESQGTVGEGIPSFDTRNVQEAVQETEVEQGEGLRDEAEEVNVNHPRDVRAEAVQYQSGNVEELVHGQEGVHDPSSHHNAPQHDDNQGQFQAGDVEHLMHGEDGVHDDPKTDAAPALPEIKIVEEFKSGDVEEMVHGKSHVHDRNADHETGPYKAGDVEEIFHGPDARNVHDPASRHKVAKQAISAGDVIFLMRGEDSDNDDDDASAHRGKVPTVIDLEHALHGYGGHDHDVRQLEFVKTKEEKEAKDPFRDLHAILMHNVDEDEHADDKIRRGKKITYKDIMELGLDEDMLQGIDLTQLLLQDAEEYDDWQREKFAINGESPEASFWEQIGELRRRYLSFGRNDGKARDLTGVRLDPEKQQWMGDRGMHEGEKVKDSDEDDVLHELELLGNTAALRDRHKHGKDRDHTENGRDLTDL